MKIEIVSGQPYAPAESKFEALLLENNVEKRNTYYLPERCILNQKILLKETMSTVEEHMKADRDLYILTYSDYVLTAVRVVIKRKKFNGAKLHQVTSFGKDVTCEIGEGGQIHTWLPDIFFTDDREMGELILD